MGEEFTRKAEEEGSEESLEKLENIMDKAINVTDKMAKAGADMRTAVEKKNAMDEADGTKKKSSNSSKDNENGGDNMNASKIQKVLEKVRLLKGPDVTVEELEEFVEENPEQVNNLINDFM